MPTLKQVTFPHWPTWNFQFPEKDLMLVHAVKYWPAPLPPADPPAEGEPAPEPVPDPPLTELPADRYRLAIGRNGVSALVLLQKGNLPPTAERPDAVIVDYEP